MKLRTLVVFLLLLLPAIVLAQDEDNRAGLLVQFSDGRVVEACVNFKEEHISGEELLRRAGLPIVAQSGGMGAAVCQIDGEGCAYPQEPCFCKCQGADCAYWSFQQRVEGAWRYLNQGASAVDVSDGDVYGWTWGAGSGVTLPSRSFDAICPVAAAPTNAPSSPTAISSIPSVPSPETTMIPASTPATPPTSSASNYLLFGLIILFLGALLVFLRRRS